MADYYSPVTKHHYSSKEQMESMEKAYMAELEKEQVKTLKDFQKAQQKLNEQIIKFQESLSGMVMNQDEDYEDEEKLGNRDVLDSIEMRQYSLCDEVGVNYQDIIGLGEWLNYVSEKDYNKYAKILEQEAKFLNTDEMTKLQQQISKNEQSLEEKRTELNDLESERITVEGLERYYKEKESTVIRDIQANKDGIGAGIVFMIVITIIAIFVNCVMELPAVGTSIGIILNFCLLIRIIGLITGKKLMEKALNDRKNKVSTLNNEITKLEKLIVEQKNNYDKKLQEIEVLSESDEKYQKMLPKFEEAHNALDGIYTNNRKEFDDFRRKHYNKEMETFFRKLGFKLSRINRSDIKKTGTVDDYIEFIDNAVEELDKELSKDILGIEPLLGKAIDLVVYEGEVSVQIIEETFKIRKKRAEAIIEQMIELGVITGDFQVLMSKERWLELKSNLD